MDIALSILVTFLLTLVNGYFSMSEMALSTARKVLLDHDAEEGDARAATAADMIEDPTQFLAAIQVAITLVGFFSSAFAATSLSEPLGLRLSSFGMDVSIANGLATVLITLIVSYFSIVVGELVPKRIAMADAEGVSKRVAGFLRGFSHAVKPLIWLTSASANGIARLLHVKSTEDRQEVSEDEIKYMVTDSDELSDEEKSMIHEVIDLGDTIAREVMVPRVDMCAMREDATLNEVLSVMRRTGFSRIPIYRGNVDRIVGIAHIKDLISPIIDDGRGTEKISRHMRTPDFVPDTKDIIPLLSEMQSSHDQMVIVVDEYGGTAGVITIEDIVEEHVRLDVLHGVVDGGHGRHGTARRIDVHHHVTVRSTWAGPWRTTRSTRPSPASSPTRPTSSRTPVTSSPRTATPSACSPCVAAAWPCSA